MRPLLKDVRVQDGQQGQLELYFQFSNDRYQAVTIPRGSSKQRVVHSLLELARNIEGDKKLVGSGISDSRG